MPLVDILKSLLELRTFKYTRRSVTNTIEKIFRDSTPGQVIRVSKVWQDALNNGCKSARRLYVEV